MLTPNPYSVQPGQCPVHEVRPGVCPSCGAVSEVAGFVCVDCYYGEMRTGALSTDYLKGFADGQQTLIASKAAAAPPTIVQQALSGKPAQEGE